MLPLVLALTLNFAPASTSSVGLLDRALEPAVTDTGAIVLDAGGGGGSGACLGCGVGGLLVGAALWTGAGLVLAGSIGLVLALVALAFQSPEWVNYLVQSLLIIVGGGVLVGGSIVLGAGLTTAGAVASGCDPATPPRRSVIDTARSETQAGAAGPMALSHAWVF